MKNFSVNGRKISGFRIFSKSTLDIRELQAKLCDDFLGIRLDIASRITDKGRYIIVDATCRIENKYGIKVENGNLVIWGSYNTIKNALEYFGSEFLANIGDDVTRADNIELETEKKKIYTKEQLMQLLTDVYNDDEAVIIGQQTDQNHLKMPSVTIADFYEATGQYPGMVGLDIAYGGLKLPTLNDMEWSQVICEIVDYCAQGGILTASAHVRNPSGNWGNKCIERGWLGYDDTKEGYEKAFTDLITEGTEYNKNFCDDLDEMGEFLYALKENGVPVIWRPFHEMNGGWFWFSYIQNRISLEAKFFTDMWKYVHNYYTEKLGLDNLIWNYAPVFTDHLSTSEEVGGTMYSFPGKEYVDMVGISWYETGNLGIAHSCKPYLTMIEKTGLIGSIAEFGPSGPKLSQDKEEQMKLYSGLDFLNDIKRLSKMGYKFSFIMNWAACWRLHHMGYGVEFMNDKITLGQKDLAEKFAKLK